MSQTRLFIGIVEILVEKFCHGEHVNPVGLEDRSHLFVADDMTFVRRILKIVDPDVFPDFLGCLGTRQLSNIRNAIESY
jgi:hypothetical protein